MAIRSPSSAGSARFPRGRRRRVRSAGFLLVASVAVAILPQSAAQGDPNGYPASMTRTYRVYAGSFPGTPSFCVYGRGNQRHRESHITTYTEHPNCGYYPRTLPVGTIRHRAEYFKGWPGQPYHFCAYVPEKANPYQMSGFTTSITWDVWPQCNFGPGVWVDITMDTWNYALYAGDWRPWYGGGAIRPITSHCHCP
jgi:hypothetical protein